MVKLTIDLIARGTSGYTKKKRDESVENYLKRLTHLYLEDRSIDEIVSTKTKMSQNILFCFQSNVSSYYVILSESKGN
jgi:protein phosphatase 1 regulatory subunit 42